LHPQEHHHDIPVFVPHLKVSSFATRLLGEDDAKRSSVFPGFIFYTLAAACPIDGSLF